ncbi:hypothetical protein SAMN02745126_06081 [Enhydrobacter aerosaccus]|uniref:Uncharacterized protein n=1 Tax=Enhydrobacter aerosaccus TaxID=225324 RepID=A0A1T4TE09_9HYPH|nr:hypothetical protein [Enhydrobacter aerosaccus]SKA38683.1 hypothetical protein SAMN02745126_06081 [Enhydrobacter aerosaccus]
MALGTIAGALLAARCEAPRFSLLVTGSAIFGTGCALAAIAPRYWPFGGVELSQAAAGYDTAVGVRLGGRFSQAAQQRPSPT